MNISEVNNEYSYILTTPFRGRQIVLLPNEVQEQFVLPENVEVVYSKKDFYNIDHANLRVGQITASNAGYKSNKEIVENSISGGLSPLEAVNVYKAQRAYGLATAGVNPRSQLYAAEAEA